jgi:hypothetical protein
LNNEIIITAQVVKKIKRITAAFSCSRLRIAGRKPSKKAHMTATIEIGHSNEPKHSKINISVFKIIFSKAIASMKYEVMARANLNLTT